MREASTNSHDETKPGGFDIKPWLPFLIGAAIVLIAAVLVLMMLGVLPTPSFLRGFINALTGALSNFEAFFVGRFS